MKRDEDKTREQLIDELVELRKRVTELETAAIEREGADKELLKRTHQLGERAKELKCLQAICELVQKQHISLGEMFQGAVDLIPPGWQYPEITCARITLDDTEFKTDTFKATEWKQATDIQFGGQKTGALEVCYLEERHEIDINEGPFLAEEKILLETIAGALGGLIEGRQAKEELRRARDDYLQITNLTGDIIVHIDKEGRRAFVNDVACEFWGKPREELLGAKSGAFAHPDDVEKTTAAIQEIIEARGPVRGMANRQQTPQGWRTVEWNACPIFDEAGNHIGRQVTGRDITEHERAKEALKRSENRLRLLSGRIIRAQEEERRRISRELHDQLGQEAVAIKMGASLLARRLEDEPALKEQATGLATIAGRLTVTANRIAADLRPGVLDDGGLVRAVQTYVEEFERRTGISCPLDVPRSEPGVTTREAATAAYRILQEALTNVWRHARASRVKVSLGLRGGRMVVRVSDNGVGVDTSQLSDASSLGLFGMRERAGLVGGTLQIRSSPGGGTQVTAYLPIEKH